MGPWLSSGVPDADEKRDNNQGTGEGETRELKGKGTLNKPKPTKDTKALIT
jgi:hypothetical protein